MRAIRLGERARALLHSAHAPQALAGLALLMSLPSLGLGLQLDDRTYLRLFAAGRSPLELLHESAAAIAQEKHIGVFAWWSGEQFSIHFLRPLAAYSHWLDYQLWPNSAWLMHLSNCLVYALLVGVAAALYRELVPANAELAGLAALMFAVDESHAQSVGWIASRHVLLSSLFALSAVYLHVRSKRHDGAWQRWASVACSAVALLSAEYGVCVLAYLVAYACVFESGRLHRRLWSVWPHLLVGGLLLTGYIAIGGGVRGASWYRDPWSTPAHTLLEGLADLPLWLLSQLGGDVANVALAMRVNLVRVLALCLLLPLLVMLVPALAASKPARFFAAGMLASCVLLFATVPQDRLLLAASFGGFGWLACFMCGVSANASAFVRSTADFLRVPHLLVAPLMFIPLLGGLTAIDGAAQALADAVPTGTSQAIALNVPLELLTNAAWSVRHGSEVPLHQLYAGFSPLKVTRPDARTLELAVEAGWGTRPLERMFTAAQAMPQLGAERVVAGMHVTVLAVSTDGLPQRVRFEFADALETPSRVWLVWQDRRPVRWTPPAIGTQVEVPPASMLSLVL